MSIASAFLLPWHIVTGPNPKDCDGLKDSMDLEKAWKFRAEASGMPLSRMTQIFKASLVFLRELEPNSCFSLRDSKSPMESRIWLWSSTLHHFSGATFQEWHVKEVDSCLFTLGSHSTHLLTIFFYCCSFSVVIPLFGPVFIILKSMQSMYFQRFWEVSNLTQPPKVDQIEKGTWKCLVPSRCSFLD